MLGGAETSGVVARIDGDVAIVDVRPQSGCGRCAEPGGCGRQADCAPRSVRMPNRIGARAGDAVTLSIGAGSVLKAALLSYGLCAVLTIAFAEVGRAWFGTDGAAIAGALLGILSGLVAMRLAQKSADMRDAMQPTIRFSSRLVHREEEK